jgi:hypothetical protein
VIDLSWRDSLGYAGTGGAFVYADASLTSSSVSSANSSYEGVVAASQFGNSVTM